MTELFIITGDEGQLLNIFTNKKKALEKVKPYQQVELWQKHDDNNNTFEYVGEVND